VSCNAKRCSAWKARARSGRGAIERSRAYERQAPCAAAFCAGRHWGSSGECRAAVLATAGVDNTVGSAHGPSGRDRCGGGRSTPRRAAGARAPRDVIRPEASVAVYLCREPVDMRKQAAGLALLIEQSLGRSVFREAAIFGFANARRDRVKLVAWERNGLVLWSKRLEGRDRYVWP
jgi:hypothetical protein